MSELFIKSNDTVTIIITRSHAYNAKKKKILHTRLCKSGGTIIILIMTGVTHNYIIIISV